MAFVLTDEELEQVTHRFTAASQARVLTALGIPFKPHPTDRRLIVSRAAAEMILGGPVGTAPSAQVAPAEWRRYIFPIGKILASSAPFVFGMTAEPGCYVYFLMTDHEVFYVGQSVEIGTRLRYHWAEYKERLTRLAVISVPPDLLDTVESVYIHWLRPPANAVYPGCYLPDGVMARLEETGGV